jgi:hypothetical protein
VLLERADLADSTAVAKVLAAPIAYELWSAACVADFSQWFALDAAELIALVLVEERGKTWHVERTTSRSSDASA